MTHFRKYGKYAVLLVGVLIAAQVVVSVVVRTHRMRGYLVAHLERAFGRPVEAGRFSAQILPIPELDVEGITIGEDPAFGHEYFLRAEHMTASLRWLGLLRGHFELGTMSLTRPSLILVRNADGQWNLAGWLPPAKSQSSGGTMAYGPRPPEGPSNFLRKIEFDEGRVNFKLGDEKRPFAFTNVSGSVEQVSAGRWQLRLEAQPWRSGVALQSTGMLQVRGDVAGTSARLQPAQIRVHWDRVSLADLFRLIAGNDSGVRGEFALDGNASVGKDAPGESGGLGKWQFALQARAVQIHRWDLTERSDNPRVHVAVQGTWNLPAGDVLAEQVNVELPHSNLKGTGNLTAGVPPSWSVNVESAAVQAQDLLAWYRAFQPGVAEGVAVDQMIAGSGMLHGWPLEWDELQLSSNGGVLRVPGFADPLRIGAAKGQLHNKHVVMEPMRISLGSAEQERAATAKTEKAAVKTQKPGELQNAADLQLIETAAGQIGGLRINARLGHAEQFFKLASSFGKNLNPGWELTGGVSSALEWNWGHGAGQSGRWNGTVTLSKAELQAAGLNQPIKLDDAKFEWGAGARAATITKTLAFGATWSGTLTETPSAVDGVLPTWQFKLHADRLEATELDRWFGPRARPNWLQRLLPSLLGGSGSDAKVNELLRRISAQGELSVDALTIERLKFTKAQAQLSLRDLRVEVHDAEAQWAGGTVRGSLQITFDGAPKYEVSAEVDRANLSQLPWAPRWGERWAGTVSGRVHVTTSGVGREELLKQVAGRGEINLKNVEFHGWEVTESAEVGAPRPGISRWASGAGEIAIKDREVTFEAIQLDAARAKTRLAGSVEFGPDAKFVFTPLPLDKRNAVKSSEGAAVQISGSPEAPKVTVEAASAERLKR